ncbi:endolytic transglycosylase MltG [Prauserella cavernicola]|uniref:Endolytic murein transglycosylase n=1 Tax=Prauserella cavernicola TaxID=2800127 RepID=A0A934QZF6_9PSEU|nr:endolytic transglycosylase MltG [Prauserella cavernicola]MBK1788114.1 endolytic transglycosylase MltG [Prauserella cavernicola]
MSTPYDGPGGGRRRARPPQRQAPAERPARRPRQAAEPPQRPVAGDPPVPRRPRRARHAAPEPGPVPDSGQLPEPGAAPEPPPEPGPVPRRAEPRGAVPPRRPRPPARRRRSPNEGVPVDENPTEVLDLGFDDYEDYDEYYDEDGRDDRRDERSAGRYDDGYDDEYDERYEDDDDRAAPEYFEDDRDDRPEPRAPRKTGKRFLGWLAALTVIVLLAGGAYYGARELLGFGYEDYEGAGEKDVILQVEDGDSTRAIATKLDELDVVASADAFVAASEDDDRVLGVQPGYYALKTKMSGANAVSALVAPEGRVGQLQLRAGTQGDDITQPDGTVTEGVYSLLSKASCADVDGESTCVPAEELREVADTTDLAELGVPEWAVEGASKAEPGRKLEGLIAPGVYDLKPGSDAKQLLSDVLETSTLRMQAAGLPDAAGETGYSPYEVLIIASIIEREGVQTDFGKISRVIYNRLDENMRLQMDSTVNFVLDRPEVRTNDGDRERAGAYNTYKNYGLPPTPISAPSLEAITAAEQPTQGSWKYFVKCETNGLSCFATDYDEHLRNRDDAIARDVY